EQRSRITARKIRSRSALVWHEQRIAHKCGITNHMRHASGCMTWRMHRVPLQFADLIVFAIVEQMVELRTIMLECVTFIENFAKDFLHCGDSGPDAQLSTELFLNVRC